MPFSSPKRAGRIARRQMKARRANLDPHPYHSTGTRRGVEAQLDDAVSLVVRKRTPYCVLCGESDWELLECGHLFKRAMRGTRFDVHEGGNNSTLCHGCNQRDNEDHSIYVDYYVRSFTQDSYDELERRAHAEDKRSYFELVELLKDIRAMLRGM